VALRPFTLANDAGEDRTSKGTVLRLANAMSSLALRPILLANHFDAYSLTPPAYPTPFLSKRRTPKLRPILLPIEHGEMITSGSLQNGLMWPIFVASDYL
jgi:hypothetical protein